jgi:hypothetical protein
LRLFFFLIEQLFFYFYYINQIKAHCYKPFSVTYHLSSKLERWPLAKIYSLV